MSLGRPEACRPLTRRPGTWASVPGTLWRVQLFPTQIRLQGPQGQRLLHELPIQGPVRQWTAQLDLDRHEIRLWGAAKEPFEGSLRAREGALQLRWAKNPEPHLLVSGIETGTPCQERLQFGNHSIQDVDKLGLSIPLSHAMPTWFRLGMALPAQQAQPQELSLLGLWAQLVSQSNRSQVGEALLQTRQAGFQDLWAPQPVDHGFWGFGVPPTQQDAIHLLAAGARLIRSMILQMDGPRATLLPCLPKELPAGRFLTVDWPGVGILELEWTRGRPRRLLLLPSQPASVQLQWLEGVARVRPLKDGVPNRHEARSLLPGQPLEVVPGRPLLLDRFSTG